MPKLYAVFILSVLFVFASVVHGDQSSVCVGRWNQKAPTQNWRNIASSSDGLKLAVGVEGGSIWTSADGGYTWEETGSGTQPWDGIASSSDGTMLAATTYGGHLFTSIDAGVSWTQTSAPWKYWSEIASSADGEKLFATASGQGGGDNIWISTNSGNTWEARGPWMWWNDIASSADGTKLVAGVCGSGGIWISLDSGISWTSTSAISQCWLGIASSSDGTKVAAVGMDYYSNTPGYVWLSADYGNTWVQTSAPLLHWYSVASSSDGSKLIAGSTDGGIWTSADSGITWTKTFELSGYWTWVSFASNGTSMVAIFHGKGIYTYTTVCSNADADYIGCFNDGANDEQFAIWGYNGGPAGGNYKYFFSNLLTKDGGDIWLTKDECIREAASDGYEYLSIQGIQISNGITTSLCFGGNNTDYDKYGAAPSCPTTTNPSDGYRRCCSNGVYAVFRGNGDCNGMVDIQKYTRETTLQACQERCANEASCSAIMYTESCNPWHGGELCVLYSGSGVPSPDGNGCAQCYSISKNNFMSSSTTMKIFEKTATSDLYLPSDTLNDGVIGSFALDGSDSNILNGDYNPNTRAVIASDRFQQNKAYSFDGVNSYIKTSISFPLQALPKSFSVWFSVSTVKRGWIIAGGSDAAGGTGFGLYLKGQDGGLLFHAHHGVCDYLFYTLTNSDLNTWQHVVITYDGITIFVYMNGVFIGSRACVLNTEFSLVKIGLPQSGNEPGNNQDFAGKIDDFIAYNRALTDTEARRLYNRTLVPDKQIYGGDWTGAVYRVIPFSYQPATQQHPTSLPSAHPTNQSCPTNTIKLPNGECKCLRGFYNVTARCIPCQVGYSTLQGGDQCIAAKTVPIITENKCRGYQSIRNVLSANSVSIKYMPSSEEKMLVFSGVAKAFFDAVLTVEARFMISHYKVSIGGTSFANVLSKKQDYYDQRYLFGVPSYTGQTTFDLSFPSCIDHLLKPGQYISKLRLIFYGLPPESMLTSDTIIGCKDYRLDPSISFNVTEGVCFNT